MLFRTRIMTLWVVLVGIAAGCDQTAPPLLDPPDPPDQEVDSLALEVAVSGLSAPVDLTSPVGDPRLFIVEQAGRIRIASGGVLLPTPFLDIRSRVTSGGERGLFGLAFPPDYASTGRFYVHYSGDGGDTRIARFTVSADPNLAIETSEEVLVALEQPYANHNGGQIRFGPDGMLYIGLGDGGSGGDPLGAGQDGTTLLGSLLRIDVSGPGAYTIPPDNPFVGSSTLRPEIWATGLRNPWRFSFDTPSGLLFIGDVGQNRSEEIDAAPLGEGGLNYGWNVMEGLECFNSTCNPGGFVLPVYVYGRSDGCSVTGGVVYRGTAIPGLVGAYLFSDYCQGWIRIFRVVDNQVTDLQELNLSVNAPTAFGTDSDGEVYVLSGDGNAYRFAPAGS